MSADRGKHALVSVKGATEERLFAVMCTDDSGTRCRYRSVLGLSCGSDLASAVDPKARVRDLVFVLLYGLDVETEYGKLAQKASDAGWTRQVQITGDVYYLNHVLREALPSPKDMEVRLCLLALPVLALLDVLTLLDPQKWILNECGFENNGSVSVKRFAAKAEFTAAIKEELLPRTQPAKDRVVIVVD